MRFFRRKQEISLEPQTPFDADATLTVVSDEALRAALELIHIYAEMWSDLENGLRKKGLAIGLEPEVEDRISLLLKRLEASVEFAKGIYKLEETNE